MPSPFQRYDQACTVGEIVTVLQDAPRERACEVRWPTGVIQWVRHDDVQYTQPPVAPGSGNLGGLYGGSDSHRGHNGHHVGAAYGGAGAGTSPWPGHNDRAPYGPGDLYGAGPVLGGPLGHGDGVGGFGNFSAEARARGAGGVVPGSGGNLVPGWPSSFAGGGSQSDFGIGQASVHGGGRFASTYGAGGRATPPRAPSPSVQEAAAVADPAVPVADADLQTPPHGQEAPLRRHLDRRMSSKSEDTVEKLADFRRQFDDIEASMNGIVGSLHLKDTNLGKARDELAQLEATLDKLQCKGVDSIDTFELDSGKDVAKSMRKELTARAEKIHDRMDEIFKEIKQAQKHMQP